MTKHFKIGDRVRTTCVLSGYSQRGDLPAGSEGIVTEVYYSRVRPHCLLGSYPYTVRFDGTGFDGPVTVDEIEGAR